MFNKKYAKGGVIRGGRSGEDYVPERGEWIIPLPKLATLEMAIDYIKGYCNKHIECDERCRLYDIKIEHCIFFDSVAGPPCDWEIPKREEEDKEDV